MTTQNCNLLINIDIVTVYIGYNYKSPDNSMWPKFVNRNNSVIFIKEIKIIRHQKILWIKKIPRFGSNASNIGSKELWPVVFHCKVTIKKRMLLMTLLRKSIFKIRVFKMYFLLNLHKHIYYRYKADQKVELQIIDQFFIYYLNYVLFIHQISKKKILAY